MLLLGVTQRVTRCARGILQKGAKTKGIANLQPSTDMVVFVCSVAFNVFLFVVANRSVLQVCPKPIILVEKLHPFLAVAKTFSRRENLFSRTTECALLPLRVE